jgi:phosphate transport system protein
MAIEAMELDSQAEILTEVRRQSLRMINTVAVMFDRAVNAVFGEVDAITARDAVLEMDRQVDRTQREIRRGLVLYLGGQPKSDAECCLALMVVAKDAERAGDYCKNLLELATLAHGALGDTSYGPVLREMCDEVSRLFAPVRSALTTPEMALVRLVVARAADIRTRCTTIIRNVANDTGLTENHAVCVALAFRGCRRISAHLANIVSAAAGPVYGLGETADVLDACAGSSEGVWL